MKIVISGIWFSKNGSIPDSAIQNLKSRVADAHTVNNPSYAIDIILWTDLKKLNQDTLEDLTAHKILVKDYRENFHDPLLQDAVAAIEKFIAFGDQGDIPAYAIASDILRIILLYLCNPESIFIYADVNDVKFVSFKEDIINLETKLKSLPWGFALTLMPKEQHLGLAAINNDVILALKYANPNFFQAFFNEFFKLIADCTTNYQAQADQREAVHNVLATAHLSKVIIRENHLNGYYLKNNELVVSETNLSAQNVLRFQSDKKLGYTWLASLPKNNSGISRVSKKLFFDDIAHENSNAASAPAAPFVEENPLSENFKKSSNQNAVDIANENEEDLVLHPKFSRTVGRKLFP